MMKEYMILFKMVNNIDYSKYVYDKKQIKLDKYIKKQRFINKDDLPFLSDFEILKFQNKR